MPREQTYRPAQTETAPEQAGLTAVALMLWREKIFMLAVFLLCFALLAAAVFLLLEKTYTASASLLVRADPAYAYNPAVGGTAVAGTGLAIDQIVQSEINILGADVLKRRALDALGLRTVYPELAEEYLEAETAAQRERIMSLAVAAVGENLGVATSPSTPNIYASFTHEQADVSARFLNELITQYQTYRQDVLLAPASDAYQQQRDQFEARLASANIALEEFLIANGIGEFESYRTNLQARQSEVDQALYAARADAERARAQLASLRAQIGQMPAETEQYVEENSSAQLLDLMVQKEDLLARYTEDSIPVQELQARIDQLSAFLAAGGAEGAGARRVGPNPVRQELQTREAELAAETQALDRLVAELNQQRIELRDEQLRVQALVPRYDQLARNINALQATVNEIAASQENNRAQRDLAVGALDNVSIVQPAVTPAQGSSMKKPALAGAFLVSGFLALLAGLARGLLRGGPELVWVERIRPARETPPAEEIADEQPVFVEPEPVFEPEPEPVRYAPPPGLPLLAVIERRAPAPAYG